MSPNFAKEFIPYNFAFDPSYAGVFTQKNDKNDEILFHIIHEL